ncbi:MAG: hypothetical protein H0T74_14040, partial [Rubrobacteraceae bacterium]|nr:hypothetical protein [Rubrobacteraceae bacterium]
MMAQPAFEKEEIHSRQEDFRSLPLLALREGLPVAPGESSIGDRDTIEPVESDVSPAVAGRLVTVTGAGEKALQMKVRMEQLPNGSVRAHFADEATTIGFTFHVFVNNLGNININTQYTNKPLRDALLSARFLNTLATESGHLFAETHQPVFNRFLVHELPIAVPEHKLLDHKNRLRLLEDLYEIWTDAGVEIRYPAETDDVEGYNNLQIVLDAVRGGWVAQPVETFDTPMNQPFVQDISAELAEHGTVRRAFVFDVPDESYRVFGEVVHLGPSRRYLSGAQLVTSLEELQDWLKRKSNEENTLALKWEPVDDLPMHIF